MTKLYKKTNYIPDILYNEIVKCLPIVSVEAVIVLDGSLLLLKRNNEPAKNEWWFPGGRMLKGESFKETLVREIREETGLEINSFQFINVYSRIFPERHDITIAYLCKCKGKIKLNNEHSEYRLVSKDFSDLHNYMLETIKDSKWSIGSTQYELPY
jgi:colanic acid biosynthesis protein WcaH